MSGAKFLSPDEVRAQAKQSYDNARAHVETRYNELGNGFGTALFDVCKCLWGTGPATTAVRQNGDASDHIIHAWQYREHVAGLLLQKYENQMIPLFMQNTNLAERLCGRGGLWIDFKRVAKELEQ